MRSVIPSKRGLSRMGIRLVRSSRSIISNRFAGRPASARSSDRTVISAYTREKCFVTSREVSMSLEPSSAAKSVPNTSFTLASVLTS